MRSPTLFCVFLLPFVICLNAGATSTDWAEAPKPAYPLRAAFEGDIGEVKLRVVVNSDGRVRDATIVKSSGKQELDHSARAAVLTWRLNKSRIQPRDLTSGREIIVDFRETDKGAAYCGGGASASIGKRLCLEARRGFSFPARGSISSSATDRTNPVHDWPRWSSASCSTRSQLGNWFGCSRGKRNSDVDSLSTMGRRNCGGADYVRGARRRRIVERTVRTTRSD